MSTYESLREDARRDRYDDETWCRSRDPYCANFPAPSGSYEAYKGELCSDCIDAETECVYCGESVTHEGDVCPVYEAAR